MASKAPQASEKRTELELGPLDDMFGYLLGRAFRAATRAFDNYFAGLDLTSRQFAILSLLGSNPGCSPGDLVAPTGITQNNLVSVIDDLILRGLVSKTTSEQDRRARALAVTEAGRRLLDRAYAIHDDYEAAFRERVGANELTNLTRLLHHFG